MSKTSIKYGGRAFQAARISFLLAFFYITFLIVAFRLIQIQLIKHDFYKAIAQDQHEFLEKTFPKRGEIYIQDAASNKKYPIAVNKDLNLVYAVPNAIADKNNAAKKVSILLGADEGKIFAQIDKENDPYEVLAHKVDDETANNIKEGNIKGIGIMPETIRYYPGKTLASSVVGFLGYKNGIKAGQYGIEGYFNKSLEGEMGYLELEKDVSGSWISIGAKNETPPRNGTDYVLTIDQTIQYISEKKLKEAIAKWEATGGNVIIVNPKTGEVITMAQYPTFDPNEYNKEEKMEVFLNSGIHDTYEPGSIEKTITMAIGIDLGKITQISTYEDYGSIVVDGWRIKNSDGKAHGTQTMVQVLENSLNTGSTFVQQQVSKDDFLRYLKSFNLDELTEIELEGEGRGSLENLKIKNDVNYATASFGQGISVTPLSILMAISSFANEGKLMRPSIVSEVVRYDGTVEKREAKYVRKVVSAKTASIISAMMVSVVENGHAKKAKIKGYKIAGKTGTAQIPKKQGRGYEEDQTIHTFVGFGPIPGPRFAMLVKIDRPKADYAESTAVPLFKELAEELINYYNIPPTEKLE